ncbi:MAG: hypothetical protein MJ152_02075 [Clostridia bacterium]|nr:hypothetical protein [Clostridia bacterium]
MSVIVALAVFLVVKSNFDSKPQDEGTSTTEYAESLTLNCAENYTAPVGAKLKFHNYISAVPSKFKSSISHCVLLNGVEYSHNIFVSNTFIPTEIGNYTIQFSLPKSETENFVKSVNIMVVPMDNFEGVKIKKTVFEIDDEITFEDLFDVNLTYVSKDVKTNANLKFENNTFIAKSSGNGTIELTLNTGHCDYEFNFAVEIFEELPTYSIKVVRVYLNSQKTYCFIDYTLESNVEHAPTEVDVQVSNSNATLVSALDGVIKLAIVNVGEVDVTITHSSASITIAIDLMTGEYITK